MTARWSDSDNLNGREALVVGGPSEGLRVVVNRKLGYYRWPDLGLLDGYDFDDKTWTFRWRG